MYVLERSWHYKIKPFHIFHHGVNILTVFAKCHRLSINEEIFSICLTYSSIQLVNLTSFSWALITTSTLFVVNMSNVVQKCPALIRKMLVSMSDVVKNIS